MRKIAVTFADGRKVVYTMAIFGLLLTDASVRLIVDVATGKVLYRA